MEAKGVNVLVVDDNQDNLTVVRAVLADTFPGAKVETALNGLSGLAKARTVDPDVILLDIVMPEMDGFEVCRRLKQDEDLRNIPVVFLTAIRSDRESCVKALEAGGEAFLSKPFDETELTAQIRAMAKIKAANERERREKERLTGLVAERTRALERELAERRLAEDRLRVANQKLELDHASILNYLEDLKVEMDARKRSELALRESEQRYRSLFENSGLGMFESTVEGKILRVNAAYARMFGFDSPDSAREGIQDVAKSAYVIPERRAQFIEDALQKPGMATFETEFRRRDGSTFIGTLKLQSIAGAHARQPYLFGFVEDTTERKLAEQTRAFLAQCGSTAAGEDFFKALARYLAQSLQTYFVCIDRLQEGNLEARTLAVFCDGKFEDNLAYALKDTPCGEVVGKTICCFTQKVCEKFPNDPVLQAMKAEGYIGTTLWSSQGQPIGLIALIWREPLVNPELAKSVLSLVAGRAAGELERRWTEKALRDSELLYHSLVENIPQCILRKDRAGRFVFCNQNFSRLIGCSLEQLLGKTDADFFPPELARKYREDDQRVMDEGRNLEIVEENVTEQGSRWMEVVKSPVRDAAGRVLGVQAVFWDISARRKLEAEREKALADYQMLFNKMIDGFALHQIICDPANTPVDYRFLAVNPAFENLTGLRSETVVGHTVRAVLPQIDPFWIKTYGHVALSGEPTSFEHYERQMGRHFQVTAFCPERGQFACLFADITKRKRMEQALRDSLQEKESLLKEVHHRVKNNLQIVVSLLSLQSNRVHIPEVVDSLRETQSRVRAMALLHETLYRSADLAHIEFQTYLDTLCKHLFRSYGPETGRLKLEVKAAGVNLGLDQAVPCGLIVSELVSNCLKHAFPEGRTGAIAIELRPEAGPSLRLSVADTGMGLPPDFDARRAQSLGLQLVFNLARQLHGTVEIAPGPGTRVAITIPLLPTPPMP